MRTTERLVYLFAAFLFIIPCNAFSQDSSSHTEAATELLAVMKCERSIEQSVEISLVAQLNSRPELRPYESIMRTFLSKYMGWSYLQDKLVALYRDEFTELELRTMIAFYKTAAGQKVIERLPVLLVKGAEIGQQAVREHLNELTEAVQNRAAELNEKD